MKRYFSLPKPTREVLNNPCRIIFEEKECVSFCNTFTIAITTEQCVDLETSDAIDIHLKGIRAISYSGIKKKIKFSDILKKAKERGYRLKKSECSDDFKFLFKFDDAYFKVGLVHAAYSIIDDGGKCIIYHDYGERNPLIITTSLGVCAIMPVIRVNEGSDRFEILEI